MALTQEQIFAAADEIDARGQAPTLTAVRQAVGGGSFTTISEAMAVWRARREARKTGSAEPVPDALSAALGEFGQSVWAAAVDLAQARLASEREKLEQERNQAEAVRAEAVQLADALTADLDRLQHQLQQTLERAQQAEQGLAGAREDLTEERVRAAGAESRATELEERVRAMGEESQRLHSHNEQLGLALTRLAGAQAGQVDAQGTGKGPDVKKD
ncbi:hypothetical protein G3A43_06825 [Paraburkholderia aspalathi]|nr:DNA-binding protein [Paraburkholderia aspalathi]MBK3779964.1 hypothetical protein [Paraburkholderia aspalathi]